MFLYIYGEDKRNVYTCYTLKLIIMLNSYIKRNLMTKIEGAIAEEERAQIIASILNAA